MSQQPQQQQQQEQGGGSSEPTYKYAKGSSQRPPFVFAQRASSFNDLSSMGPSSNNNFLQSNNNSATSATSSSSSSSTEKLSQEQVHALVEPIAAAMQQTTFYDIMGTSTQVVVLDVNTTVSVCVAAAQETQASCFLIWEPQSSSNTQNTGRGRFVTLLTLTNFIQILLHCHENQEEVTKISNMPLRELINQQFAKVRSSTSIVHKAPDVSLFELLDTMIQSGINHVPIYADASPSSEQTATTTSSAASATPGGAGGGMTSPTSIIGIAFLPQLLSQVVRIINSSSGSMTTSGGTSPTNAKYQSLFDAPLSALPNLGSKLNSRDVDGSSSWLRPEETVYVALKRLVEYNVQALPIINEHEEIIDTFARSDVISLEDLGVYNLNQPVKQAVARVRHRTIVVCEIADTIGDVVAHFVATGVRSMFVVRDGKFVGQVQVADLLKFLFKAF